MGYFAKRLCGGHLLGEHRELHAIWAILTQDKKGYPRHPETIRWKGKLKALYLRHKRLVREMERRGYRHKGPLDSRLATGYGRQDRYEDVYKKQIKILNRKRCGCKVSDAQVQLKEKR